MDRAIDTPLDYRLDFGLLSVPPDTGGKQIGPLSCHGGVVVFRIEARFTRRIPYPAGNGSPSFIPRIVVGSQFRIARPSPVRIGLYVAAHKLRDPKLHMYLLHLLLKRPSSIGVVGQVGV